MTEVKQKRINGFDYFVLAGLLMNVLIVVWLFGFWLLH
ncbi:Uncharacterised protein [Candidatus Venteria ishoeyi]|uniref:Uncharacterized protein n=1 Tax=Candidatus Venteria ishoeyi TaxID=1899563 RepID=A0A1H6FB19_9GAMM|nr:Uncharacterised protein [Candidatus Venteria ishoeyi]